MKEKRIVLKLNKYNTYDVKHQTIEDVALYPWKFKPILVYQAIANGLSSYNKIQQKFEQCVNHKIMINIYNMILLLF